MSAKPAPLAVGQATVPSGPMTILCVDDEPNILSSLKRLLRGEGFRILTAPGGAEGLHILQQEQVDLVISDMRMPGMDGAQFLAQARAGWPDTARILLTGYAEITPAIAAINSGEIYRYISKPWDDHDVRLCVRGALERKAMQLEARRLEALTFKQNEELRELNLALEAKVAERTAHLRKALVTITQANEKLKSGFLTSIKVFANLLELRGGALAGHSRRVSDLARRIATQLNLPADAVQTVMLAGLLHDIGKIGLPDALIGKPESRMSSDEVARFRTHAVRGESALMALDDAQDAARLLRSHHEYFDGSGYPDRLAGESIPIGARILAVASDFDALQVGTLLARSYSANEAHEFIIAGRGSRYDPQVVAALNAALLEHVPDVPAERVLESAALEAGMVLSRDIESPAGALLLAANHALTTGQIERIRAFEQHEGLHLEIYVGQGKE
jgi:response regulator RpfG family c-di-GMP phosphodiesterase